MTQANKQYNTKQVNLQEILNDEPYTYEEAINSQFSSKWKKAFQSEIDSQNENKTWTETILPKSKNIIRTRWIFKIKKDSNNIPKRFKARLVAKGYEQQKGKIEKKDNETFAPVIKQQSLRLLLATAEEENLIIHHKDISTC